MNFNTLTTMLSFLIGFIIAQETEVFKPKLLPRAFANNLTYVEPGGAGQASLVDTDGKVFTCGGRNATHVSPLCQGYNVPACFENSKSRLCRVQNELEIPRWGAGVGHASDTMYVIGGFTNVEGTAVTDSIEKITRSLPVEDEYKLSIARALPLVLTSKDKIVVAGGLSYNNVKKEYVQHKQLDIFRPDPNNNGWYSPQALLKQGRAESCGGWIASIGGQDAAIIAGGRGANPNTIYKDIEILTVDDKIQDTLFELQTARYACVAVTATNRRSVYIMGGIGLATATPGPLSSIERVFADRVETVSFALSVRRSHSALVVALPFVFVIGGQTRGGVDIDLPANSQGTNALDVLRLNADGAELVASKPTLVDKRSYAQAAHVEELNGVKTVVVFGGFIDGVSAQPSVDVIQFSTNTYAPTPAPMPKHTEPPPTPLPPTPPPTPQVNTPTLRMPTTSVSLTMPITEQSSKSARRSLVFALVFVPLSLFIQY